MTPVTKLRRGWRRAAMPAMAAAALLLAAQGVGAGERSEAPSGNIGQSYTGQSLDQSWDIENGLPQNSVQALLQTRDGFLWIGTESGLARFDGVTFRIFDSNSNPSLPGNDIRCLLETHDGALWIGTSSGLAKWKDGAITAYSTRDGLPANGIQKLIETSDDVLWAWTDLGLARLSGNGFIPGASGVDGAAITAVLTTERGGLMVKSPQRTMIYRSGRWSQMETGSGSPGDDVALSTYMAGEPVYASNRKVLISGSAGRGVSLTVGGNLPGSRVQALLADREGGLWIGTNEGLARWNGSQVQKSPESGALSSASVLSLLEDAEGNLWVGTENAGLHVLRRQRFRTWGVPDGLSSNQITTVTEDAAGTIWVGTARDGLNALRRSGNAGSGRATGIRTYAVKDGLASDVILALAAAPNGDVWVGTPDGLSRMRGGRVITFTSADGLPDDFIRSLFIDTDGSLWIGTRRGLTHWSNAAEAASQPPRLRTYTHANGLGSDLIGAIARDTDNDLWIATLHGLSRMRAGNISTFTAADGLSDSVVTALLPQADGTLLIGTENHGWDAWDGKRFTPVSSGDLDQSSIHGILSDHSGHLWFSTSDGIARCDSFAAGQPPACAGLILFGAADGVPGRETAMNSHPSVWRSRDGRLWFATREGLVEVDPAHFTINTVPPPVAIERFAADGTDEPLDLPTSLVKIAAGHAHFEFDYAALSFVAPHKVRYRYMLEGFDSGWTDAGTRRSAFYTNIPAGHYTFRVQAENNDGIWNTTGASLSFELRPHFYQTLWFYALLVAAVTGMILFLIRRRLGRAKKEFRAVLAERSRIAREIHDTLAQGYVGVSVQLEVLGQLLRRRKIVDAEEQLERTRDFVREGLADARQSIWALRTPDASETNLPVRMRRAVEAADGAGLESQFNIYGAYRPLAAETEGEMLRIAEEAIRNAKKHAGASRLSVRLEYRGDEVTVEVCDDGRGGADEAAPGRFGLTGMRERAAAIGGTLELSSEQGKGTAVRLRAPAVREK